MICKNNSIFNVISPEKGFCFHTLLTLQPFQNFARYHTDNKPFGTENKARSFVICSECGKKHGLPNPYETYSGITDQNASYEKRLDNYTDSDLMNDRDE